MIYRLTNKNHLDKRCHAYKWLQYYKANKNLLHGALALGILFGLIFGVWSWRKAHASPEPLISPLSEQEVIQDYKDAMYPKWMYEVAPQSVNGVPMWMQPSSQPCLTPDVMPISWNDAIRQEFPSDIEAYMIRICMAENKGQNPYATNWNGNGTFDHSWCQVNSVHKPDTMSDTEWKLYLENPVNHAKEVKRIYDSQGFNAWTVYKYNMI